MTTIMKQTSSSLGLQENRQSFDTQPFSPEGPKAQSSATNLSKLKKILWGLGFCGTLLLIIGIAGPFIIQAVIDHKVKDDISLKADHYNKWGQFPGKTGLQIQRQMTFYNFTNPEDFFVRNKKPIMQETQKVVYQENMNLTNPVYSEDGSIVDYDYLRDFIPIGSSTGQESASVVNIGPLGFWYASKNAHRHSIAIQAFYHLIEGMSHKLKHAYLAAQMQQSTTQSSFNSMAVTGFTGTLNEIFTDPNYGFNKNTDIWIRAYQENADSAVTNKPTCQILCQYFKFSYASLKEFFTNNASQFNGSITYGTAIINSFCSTESAISTEYCLALKKWVNYGSASIAQVNTTSPGFPEISYYYSQKFLIENTDAKYQGITFPYAWAKVVLNYIESPASKDEYVKTTSTLLNAANLNFLYTAGEHYEETQDVKYLTAIANRFEINTTNFPSSVATDVAYIFYSYTKYMVDIFAQRKDLDKGGQHAATFGAIGGPAMSSLITGAMKLLPPTIVATFLTAITKSQGITTCAQFYTALGNSNIPSAICTHAALSSFNSKSLLFLYDCSIYGTSLQVCYDFDVTYKDSMGVGVSTIGAITTSTSFMTFIATMDQALYNQYGCYGTTKKCSYYELVAQQWYNMAITKTPPTMIAAYLPAGRSSMKEWFPNYLPWAFEWGYYAEKFSDTFSNATPTLTFAQITALLGYNRLFSSSQQTQILISDTDVSTKYFFTDASQLRDYLRWIVAFGAFGMTQTQTANALLSGFEDPFLKKLAFKNPQEGGDPSINWVLQFNDKNMTTSTTEPQSVYSGTSDINLVREIREIAGYSYITYNSTSFDGFSDAKWEHVSPWKEIVPIEGTDAGQNKPDLDEDSTINVYVNTVYQGDTLRTKGEKKEVNGLDTLRFELGPCMMRSSSVCPDNSKYYQDQYDMAINLTSIKKGQILNTKTHMLGMKPALSERIQVLNIDGNIQEPNESDETFLNIEPISGVALESVLNLEGGMLLENDLLFSKLQEPVLIPFFYVFRTANLTSDQVDDLFSALKGGLIAKDVLLYVGTILGGLMLVAFIYVFYNYHTISNTLPTTRVINNTSKYDAEIAGLNKPTITEIASLKPTNTESE